MAAFRNAALNTLTFIVAGLGSCKMRDPSPVNTSYTKPKITDSIMEIHASYAEPKLYYAIMKNKVGTKDTLTLSFDKLNFRSGLQNWKDTLNDMTLCDIWVAEETGGSFITFSTDDKDYAGKGFIKNKHKFPRGGRYSVALDDFRNFSVAATHSKQIDTINQRTCVFKARSLE